MFVVPGGTSPARIHPRRIFQGPLGCCVDTVYVHLHDGGLRAHGRQGPRREGRRRKQDRARLLGHAYETQYLASEVNTSRSLQLYGSGREEKNYIQLLLHIWHRVGSDYADTCQECSVARRDGVGTSVDAMVSITLMCVQNGHERMKINIANDGWRGKSASRDQGRVGGPGLQHAKPSDNIAYLQRQPCQLCGSSDRVGGSSRTLDPHAADTRFERPGGHRS